MHLPHPKEVNIARVILVFQDGGVKQTKEDYRHLLHSKTPKYVTQRWGGSGIFWESSNTSEGQYVSGLEFKYFQILHQRDPVYMGKSDWWISGGCRIGSILSSGSRLWIKKLDSEPPLFIFWPFLSILCIPKICFSNNVTGAIDSLHWWRCGLLSSVYPNPGSPLELSSIEMYLKSEILTEQCFPNHSHYYFEMYTFFFAKGTTDSRQWVL